MCSVLRWIVHLTVDGALSGGRGRVAQASAARGCGAGESQRSGRHALRGVGAGDASSRKVDQARGVRLSRLTHSFVL